MLTPLNIKVFLLLLFISGALQNPYILRIKSSGANPSQLTPRTMIALRNLVERVTSASEFPKATFRECQHIPRMTLAWFIFSCHEARPVKHLRDHFILRKLM